MSLPEQLTVTAYIDGSPTVLSVNNLVFDCDEHGDRSCTFSMLHGGTINDGDLMDAATVILIADPDTSWRWLGRLKVPGQRPWANGGCLFPYQAEGMQAMLDDVVYQHEKIWTSGERVEDIINHTLEELCPGITPAASVELRVIRERTQDFVLSSARAVLDTVAPLGDAVAPICYMVYSGGSSVPVLTTKARPTAISFVDGGYYVRMGTGSISGHAAVGGAQVEFEADLGDVHDEAVVKYRDEHTLAGYAIYVKAAGSSLLGGTTRDITLDLNRLGILNTKAILNAADAMLSQVANPQNTGRQIIIPWGTTVLDNAFAPVSPWAIETNSIIQVADQFTGNSNLGKEYYINTKRWDEKARKVTLGCGPVR